MNCAILLAAALAGAIPSSNTFHSVVETSRGWALRAGDGRLWRARGIEKANGYGPNCGALGRPYADSIKKEGLSRAKWCARTSSRLKEWGFNLLGTACDSQINSDGGFAETEMIALSSWMRDKGDEYLLKVNPNSPCTPMANVFHPEFADVCEKAAKACCSKWRGKTGFLGYYLDNELNWWGCGNWWECGLLDAVLDRLPKDHTARIAAERIAVREPNRAKARRLFTEEVARRYFSTIAAAIRRYDPDHLILGCRFAGVAGAPDVVWRICGECCDVVTLNCYPTADVKEKRLTLGVAGPILPKGIKKTQKWTPVPLETVLRIRHEVSRKPLFISEWSFRGGDVGRPRSESNGQQLPTQKERAEAVRLFLEEMERLDFVVGHAFYMWTDEVFASDRGPETLNWGLVSLEDNPHHEVAAAFRSVRSRFGFHRIAETENGWSLFDPADRPWRIQAIEKANMNGPRCEALGNVYSYRENLKKKGIAREAWVDRTADRLKSWGFNLLGTSCDGWLRRHGFAHTEMLAFGSRLTKPNGDPTLYIRPWRGRCCEQLPNVFHPRFAEVCDEVARSAALRLRNDPTFLGYYLDNELNWWGNGDWYRCGLLDAVVDSLPAGHSALIEAEKVVAAHGFNTVRDYRSSPEAVRDPARRAYTRLLAEMYFRIATEAIRRYDPNHLILGCRFAGAQGAPDEVWNVAGRYCDVVSFNCYPKADLKRRLLTVNMHERKIGTKKGRFVPRNVEDVFARIARTAGKPVFITEWSFIGQDVGLPCKKGCGHRLPTQRDRADAISLFLDVVNSRPYMIGSAFFMWTDDPAQGVSFADPEDCNYGLVNAEDEPYKLVTDAFRKANRRK